MRRVIREIFSYSAGLAIATAAFAGAASASGSEPMYVTVRESKIRAKADFFSAPVADVRYGDRLDVLSESAPWLSVRTAGGKQGFIHQSSVTDKRVVLKSGATFNGGAEDPNDVVLAGKGFSAEVERQFASAHREANFAEVNAMERSKVSPKELSTFVQQGKLGKREG